MHSSKLIQLLKVCSKKELQLFNKFVCSPFFNTNQNVVALYEYIRKCAPNFRSRKLERHRLFAAVFSGEDYKEIKLQQFMSELVGLLEEFWVYQLRKGRQIDGGLDLAAVYRDRGLPHYWQQKMLKLDGVFNGAKVLGADFHYQRYCYHLSIHEAIEEEGQRDKEPNLQELSDALDVFYLVKKLKYYYKVIVFQQFKSQEYDIGLMEEILAFVEGKEFDHPAIQIYYYGVRSYIDFEEESYFYQLKDLLREHVHGFPIKEMQNMFLSAINYCIRQLNQGNRKYLREIFELYQIEIDEQIILIDGKIPSVTYSNITMTASLLDELDWLEQFLHDFKEAVDAPDYALNIAQLYFKQSKYQQIIQLFKAADYDDVLFVLLAKAILLKTHYELKRKFADDYDYEEQLDAVMTNFNTFLHRKKRQLPKHYVYYLNLTRSLRELFRLEQDPSWELESLDQLEQRVKGTKEMAEKRWLLQKINDLRS